MKGRTTVAALRVQHASVVLLCWRRRRLSCILLIFFKWILSLLCLCRCLIGLKLAQMFWLSRFPPEHYYFFFRTFGNSLFTCRQRWRCRWQPALWDRGGRKRGRWAAPSSWSGCWRPSPAPERGPALGCGDRTDSGEVSRPASTGSLDI